MPSIRRLVSTENGGHSLLLGQCRMSCQHRGDLMNRGKAFLHPLVVKETCYMLVMSLIALLVLPRISWAATHTAISNLADSVDGSTSVEQQFPTPGTSTIDDVAAPFVVGSSAQIASVTIEIGAGGTNGLGPGLNVALYSDSAGLPGTSLAHFNGNSNPNVAGQYTYTLLTPYLAATGNKYWVVADTVAGNTTSMYPWITTLSSLSVGDAGWSIGHLATRRSFLPFIVGTPVPMWQLSSTSSALLSVGIVPVPEPRSWALVLCAVLGGVAFRTRNWRKDAISRSN
jgi:hypothetical protein